MLSRSAKPVLLSAALLFALVPQAHARKSEPLYEDPFDLGAGGASLTRASKEGRVFANPALLPQGGSFHRWLGATVSLLATRGTVDTARSIMERAGDDQSQTGGDGTQEILDSALNQPVRVGWGVGISYITSAFGLGVFSRFEPEFRVREVGSGGLPELRFTAASYHGAALGFAVPTALRWLSLGIAAKYVYAAEPEVVTQLSDAAAIERLTDPELIQDMQAHNVGVGFDAGGLIFLQGKHVDLSIAAKVDDIGGTALRGDASAPESLRQVLSGGVGVALHTGADALHLSLDYRDILGAYEELPFKRIHAGAKLLLRQYVGFSTGYYHGYPTFGAEVDLIILRIAAVAFTREMGDRPGADPRPMYLVSVSLGY